jgi:hypothetical protein
MGAILSISSRSSYGLDPSCRVYNDCGTCHQEIMDAHILSMCCYGSEFFLGSEPQKRTLKWTRCHLFSSLTLHPDFRSNIVFAVAFFLTRILFHIILGISYFLHDNRTQTTGGSYLPSILLATIFPVHAMWFYGCIMGFFRRASQRHTPYRL